MVRNRTTTSCDIKGCLIPFHFPAVDQMTACFNVTLMLQLSFVTKRWMYGKIFIKSACVSSHSNVPFIIISSSRTIFQIQKHRKKCKYMKCMNISEITISYYLRLVTYLFFFTLFLFELTKATWGTVELLLCSCLMAFQTFLLLNAFYSFKRVTVMKPAAHFSTISTFYSHF